MLSSFFDLLIIVVLDNLKRRARGKHLIHCLEENIAKYTFLCTYFTCIFQIDGAIAFHCLYKLSSEVKSTNTSTGLLNICGINIK